MDVREKLIELPIEDALLVLREEHRQRTDSYTTYLAHGGKGDPAEEVGLNALAMAISALEKTKWISVDDRLPEIPEGLAESPEPVLYMMKNTENIYTGYYGEGGVWRDKYFRQYADSREGVDANDVLCWMWQHDLPKPPKGE